MATHHSAQILTIEGADATAFAHAQFSSNIAGLKAGTWQFSAWLDAQGRVLAFFQLARLSDDSLLLLLRGGDASAMAQSLQRFVFRAKVTLTVHEPRTLGTGPALDTYAARREGDAYVLGCGDHSMVIGAEHADDRWRLPQLRAGWPWLPDEAIGQLLPPALSLERLLAVAFDKGCYPGQEIVARLHYRGGHKRHMHCVVLSQPSAESNLPTPSAKGAIQWLDVVDENTHALALAVIDDELAQVLKNDTHHLDGTSITMRITQSWPA